MFEETRAMLYVQNDDAVYVWWLEASESGFIANLGSGGKSRAVLHRGRCMHLYPPEPSKVHTGDYPKACSLNRDEVEGWVHDNGFEVVPCTACKP
jgi:hypothetical protein